MAMPLVLGDDRNDDAEYLNTCRMLRNTIEYDYVGGATEENVKELLEFLARFATTVRNWLEKTHPELL